MEKKRGGYRPGAKRPKKFGELKAEYINILVPSDFKEEIKVEINKCLKKYNAMENKKYYDVRILQEEGFICNLYGGKNIEDAILRCIELDVLADLKTKVPNIYKLAKSGVLDFMESSMDAIFIEKNFADKLCSFDIISAQHFLPNESVLSKELLILLDLGLEAKFILFNKQYHNKEQFPCLNFFMTLYGTDIEFTHRLLTGGKLKNVNNEK
jgi:hypothetical protein